MSTNTQLHKYNIASISAGSKAEKMVVVTEYIIKNLAIAQKARIDEQHDVNYNAINNCTQLLTELEHAVDIKSDKGEFTESDPETQLAIQMRDTYARISIRLHNFIIKNSPPEEYNYLMEFFKEYRLIWIDLVKQEKEGIVTIPHTLPSATGSTDRKNDASDSEEVPGVHESVTIDA